MSNPYDISATPTSVIKRDLDKTYQCSTQFNSQESSHFVTSKTVSSHSPAAQICFDCRPNLPDSYLLAAEKRVSQLKCYSRVWLHSTTASTMASMSYSLLHPLTSNFHQIGGSCSSFLFLAYMPQTVTNSNQLRGVLNNLAEHQQECAPNSAPQIVKTLQQNSDLHPPPGVKSA